jgi:phage repressor protein C with HTH and peptisase S24 domain
MNTLATRLAEVMAELNFTKNKELAAFCDVSEGLVAQWFAGTTKLGPKPLKAFGRTHFSLDWIVEGKLPKYRKDSSSDGLLPVHAADKDDPDFIQIPMVKLRLQAGVTGFQTEPERRDGGTVGMRRNWIERTGLNPAQLVAILVKGDSMEPSLYEDDIVVINTADKKPVDGTVFAVNYEGEAVVKRLARDAGDWWLTSDNPDQRKHHRKLCRGEACIVIGRVVRKESDRI